MAGDKSDLRDEIIRLGPWHLRVQVTPELSTAAWLSAPPDTCPDSYGRIDFADTRETWKSDMLRIFPNGLEGRSVLDCACNCGGFLFWAKELGAGDCLGFDVRERRIEQARFLLENRDGPSEGIRFEVCDLYDLPRLGLEPFDITLFKGIFYHLPNPIGGLKIAADHTHELIQVSTTARHDLPEGMLAMDRESEEWLMYGVYGLNWHPTGPDVLAGILSWAGFPQTRVVRSFRVTPRFGRMQVVASRAAELLEGFSPPPARAPRKPTVRRYLRALGATPDARAHLIRDVCSRAVELAAVDVNGAPSWRGRDSVLRHLIEEVSGYERYEARPEQVVDAGDRVLAFVRERGRSPGGGELDARTAALFSFRDDRIARVELFEGRQRALEAAGMRE